MRFMRKKHPQRLNKLLGVFVLDWVFLFYVKGIKRTGVPHGLRSCNARPFP